MADRRNAASVPLTFKGFGWSKILDAMVGAGSVAQGDILSRTAAAWSRLAAGTSGRFLKTLGTGAIRVGNAGGQLPGTCVLLRAGRRHQHPKPRHVH